MLILWLLLASAAATASAETLTLKQAVALAIENNPDVRAALAQQEKAQQAYREARAQFTPNLVVGSGLAATRGFPLSIEGAAPSLLQVQSSALLLNVPQRHAITESLHMWRAASSGAAARRDQIAWKTAAVYVELHKAERSLEYARREVESAERIQRAVAARVGEGREIPLELAKTRLAGARFRQQLTALEGQSAVLQAALRGLTGRTTDEPIETVDGPLPLAGADFPGSAEKAVEQAVTTHEELKRLAREVEAREAHVRSERAQRWPQLDLVGQYAVLSRANNYDRFFREFERHNVQLGMAMRFTVFDGKRIESRVSQAEADLAQARASLASARNQIALDAARLFRQVQQSEAAQEVAKLELEVARESVTITLARFEEGRIPAQELEQARAEESTHWIGYFDANFLLERARLDLLQQTGNLLAALR